MTADVLFLEDRRALAQAARAAIDEEIERAECAADVTLDDADRALVRRALRPGADGNFAATPTLVDALREFVHRPPGRATTLDRFWAEMIGPERLAQQDAPAPPAARDDGDAA